MLVHPWQITPSASSITHNIVLAIPKIWVFLSAYVNVIYFVLEYCFRNTLNFANNGITITNYTGFHNLCTRKVAALLLHIKLRTWVFLEIQFCCCWKFLSEELKSMQEIKASLKNTSSAQEKQSSSCEHHCRKLLCWFCLNFSKLLCLYCEAFLQTNISSRHLANTFLNFLWCGKKLIHSRLFITAIILRRNFSNLLVIPINLITLIYILGHSNCNWLTGEGETQKGYSCFWWFGQSKNL